MDNNKLKLSFSYGQEIRINHTNRVTGEGDQWVDYFKFNNSNRWLWLTSSDGCDFDFSELPDYIVQTLISGDDIQPLLNQLTITKLDNKPYTLNPVIKSISDLIWIRYPIIMSTISPMPSIEPTTVVRYTRIQGSTDWTRNDLDPFFPMFISDKEMTLLRLGLDPRKIQRK